MPHSLAAVIATGKTSEYATKLVDPETPRLYASSSAFDAGFAVLSAERWGWKAQRTGK